MILPKKRDPGLSTVRRGGTLLDAHHHLLAVWAADCAEHVLHFFEAANVAVAHVAAHNLGAAYAIRAARAAAPEAEQDAAGRLECQWQRARLPGEIRELVLDDQRLRNEICWSVFDV